MIVYNLSEEEVNAINDSVALNSEKYLENCFSLETFLRENQFYPRDSEIQIRDIDFNVYDEDPSKTDFENAVRLYEAMEISVAPYTAASGSFWTAMVHANLEYMAYRWPLTEDNLISRLQNRYLIDWTSSRRSRERNGLSRLWWIVYLSVLPETEPDRYALTREIMQIQDVMTNILDRDAFTPKVTRSFGRVMIAEHERTGSTMSRSEYRPLLKYVDAMDAVLMLDTLSEEDLVEKFTEYLDWLHKKPRSQTGE